MAAKTVKVISIFLGLLGRSSACLGTIPNDFTCPPVTVDKCPGVSETGIDITIQATNVCGDPPYTVQDNNEYNVKFTFTPTENCKGLGIAVLVLTYANVVVVGDVPTPYVPAAVEFQKGFTAGVKTSGKILVIFPPLGGLVPWATFQLRVTCVATHQIHVCIQQSANITMGPLICA